jgi:hypothetical protein
LGLFLPFAESLGWTALTLAAAARYVRAATWSRRLVWLVVVAAAWGQLAASHAGHGLIVGTLALAAYLAAAWWQSVRERGWSPAHGAAVVGALVPALPLVNLVYLLPRVSYLGASSYRLGFGGAIELDARSAGWPLDLATSPGTYLGAAALVLGLAALWSRRHRALVVALTTFGAVTFLLSLDVVARHLAELVDGVPGLDFYAHYPGRFALGVILVIPVLAAVGLDTWMHELSGRTRLVTAAGGVLVWLILPLGTGTPTRGLLLLVAGLVAGGLVLVAASRRPALAVLLPALLAVELVANGLIGQLVTHDKPGADAVARVWFDPLLEPTVDPAAYLRAGPIAAVLQEQDGGRYLSLAPSLVTHRGYLTRQQPAAWGLLANQRAMLFGLEDAQGYNPFQLARYWTFVRQVTHRRLDYNAAVLVDPPPVALDLLQVEWVVTSRTEPGITGVPRAEQPPWVLVQRPGAPARAQVVASWSVVAGPGEALSRVLESGFDPTANVVLEREPGLAGSPSASTGGSASYRWLGDQSARVDVEAAGPGLVLIRNVYDRHWHADVDGRAAPVLAADYLVQAVPVAAGSHVIELRYDDPTIGYGLLGSALTGGLLLLVALGLARRGARGTSSDALDLTRDSEQSIP